MFCIAPEVFIRRNTVHLIKRVVMQLSYTRGGGGGGGGGLMHLIDAWYQPNHLIMT